MLSFVFAILMIAVFGKLLKLAIKMAWGITKILFSFIFLPFILIGLAVAGLFTVAFPLLIVIGIAALVMA